MYLEDFLQQRRHFSPFVSSVDGLMGVEATATLKRLTSHLATKWNQSYSKTCGYVKSSIAISLVRATHRCIQGSWVPVHWISVQRPQWEDVAGLNLFRSARQGPHNQPTPPDTSIPLIQPPTTKNHQWQSRERTTQGRRGDREGGTGYTCPALRKRHIKPSIN